MIGVQDLNNIPRYKPRPDLPTDYVALAVIVNEGRVLVNKRARGLFLGGYWEFPGGKREAGESYARCAVREAKEEVGLDVLAVKELYPIRHDYKGRRVVLQPYLCRLAALGQSPSTEDAVWVMIDQLAEMRFPDANKKLVQQLTSGELGDFLKTD